MRKTLRTATFQGAVFVVCTVLAFTVLVRTDVVRRLAYLVEKGRIEAMREALPSADALSRYNADARVVAAMVTPAVVQIITEKRIDLADLLALHPESPAADSNPGAPGPDTDDPAALDRMMRRHQGMRVLDGYGSGFVVDAANGHIVTNDHVIANADAIHVRLADGRLVEARLLGADPRSDLAVVQIEADGLYELKLGDSDAVEVGDAVMSVGNPFGLDGTVSRGIISAKGRSQINIHGAEYRGFLQTDAVINPGNSGGPLVNLRGEVVAVNTAIATSSGHYDGVGFAIPARRIQQVLPALVSGSQVPRGYLGVTIVDRSLEDGEGESPAGRFGVSGGVLVRDVLPDSPADRHGLREGDVILSIDGRSLRHTADLIDIVGDSTPGTSLSLELERGGERETRLVTVGRQPEGFSTRRTVEVQ
jgi:serine protease Do